MKNPRLSSPYLVKQTSILSKLRYIMGQKSQQDAFFSIFLRKKNSSSDANIFSKSVDTFSKNTLLVCPYFVNKRVFSQIYMYFFFSICFTKTPSLMPIFGKKTSILSKLHYIIGQKSQYNTLFSDSMKKYCSHTHIFSKNNQFYKNTLMFFFLYEKTKAVAPIFSEKS